jgi:calcineurin-like phosphoesterase family protein
MIEKWNEVVGKDDEVYYLGDFMYKMNPTIFVKNVLNNLNGKIYHISGNHDRRYLNKYKERMEWIKDVEYMSYIHDGKEYNFVLFHYPIYSWDGMWRNSIHIHGHTHTNTGDLVVPMKGNIINVNCELLNYKPISIVDIIDKFKDRDAKHFLTKKD